MERKIISLIIDVLSLLINFIIFFGDESNLSTSNCVIGKKKIVPFDILTDY